MPKVWRKTVGVLALLLLAFFAHAPALKTELIRDDFTILESAARASDAARAPGLLAAFRSLFGVAGTAGHPVAGASLIVSQRLGARDDGLWVDTTAFLLRFEHLALLLLAAWGLGTFLRRVLQPWTGSEQASAAAWASAFLFSLHPFHGASIANLSARPNLLALALGAWAGAAFLKGRQERRYNLIVVAALTTALAGLAGGLAYCLPLVLSAAEFASAHRYRPQRTRLRTSINTLLVFAICVGVDVLFRSAYQRQWRGPSFLNSLAEVAEVGGLRAFFRPVVIAIEKLGLVLLPVNDAGIGLLGYAVAGVLVLLALQPALIAARSAPRLWGRMLLAFTILLLLSEVPDFQLRVTPDDHSLARVLFPMCAVISLGLGVASTALPGPRRRWVPSVLVAGFVLLAYGNSVPWNESGRELQRLRVDLSSAIAEHGSDLEYWVADAPGLKNGVNPLSGALPSMLSQRFREDLTELQGERQVQQREVRVQCVQAEALSAFVLEEEFQSLRENGLVLLVPRASIDNGQDSTRGHQAFRLPELATQLDGGEARDVSTGVRTWYREGRSPGLDLDPFLIRSLWVSLDAGESSAASEGVSAANVPPQVGWRADAEGLGDGALEGVWLDHTSDRKAVFSFDHSLEWLLSGRVRRVWSLAGWETMEEANLRTELPAPAQLSPPEVDGADWVLVSAEARSLDLAGKRGEWVLGLLDLSSLKYEEIAGVQELGEGTASLRLPGAETRVELAVRQAGGPMAWSLQYRVDGAPISELRGRRKRIGRRGSIEVGERP